jgi:CRISPR-associated protein Cmr2
MEDKKSIIDYFVGRTHSPPSQKLKQIQDPIARYQLLAQLAAIDEEISFLDAKGKERSVAAKDYARTGALQYNEPSGLLYWYHAFASNKQIDPRKAEGPFQGFLSDQLRWMQAVLGPTVSLPTAAPSTPDLSVFPTGAWALGFTFVLQKPCISKDDREFYILDNPVRKEWVFQVPYIAPSQWKGALRAAMVQELKWWWKGLSNDEKAARIEEFAERRFRMTLLFGDEKGEEPGTLKGLARYLDKLGGEKAANLYREKVKKFFGMEAEPSLPRHRGWLHFYPTYFDRIGLEVINPHSRETGAGKQPIYFECVPVGTKGNFTLLYVPLGDVSEDDMRADFRAVTQGLKAMFTVYGFGAKTSSGFGRAKVHWRKEEGAEVQPEEDLWEEWEKIWQDG